MVKQLNFLDGSISILKRDDRTYASMKPIYEYLGYSPKFKGGPAKTARKWSDRAMVYHKTMYIPVEDILNVPHDKVNPKSVPPETVEKRLSAVKQFFLDLMDRQSDAIGKLTKGMDRILSVLERISDRLDQVESRQSVPKQTLAVKPETPSPYPLREQEACIWKAKVRQAVTFLAERSGQDAKAWYVSLYRELEQAAETDLDRQLTLYKRISGAGNKLTMIAHDAMFMKTFTTILNAHLRVYEP